MSQVFNEGVMKGSQAEEDAKRSVGKMKVRDEPKKGGMYLSMAIKKGEPNEETPY